MNRVSGTCGTVTLLLSPSEAKEYSIKKNKLKKYWLNFSERHKSIDSRSSANSKQKKFKGILIPKTNCHKQKKKKNLEK